MRKQICLQFKDAMEESNQNNFFLFKQDKNKKKDEISAIITTHSH